MSQKAGESTGDLAVTPILDVVRSIHVANATGTLIIDAGDQKRRLFFRQGQLFLAASHPLARKLGELVGEMRPTLVAGKRTVEEERASEQTAGIVRRMAQVITDWRDGTYTFDGDAGSLPAEVVGPLPTARLIMVGSTLGVDETQLLARLGGLKAKLIARDGGAPPDALGFAPEETFLTERLRQPMTVEAILGESPVPRRETLERLVQLKAISRLRVVGRSDSGPSVVTSVDADLVRRLFERFDRDLQDDPLRLSAEEYRSKVTALLGRVGGMTAYELLEIDSMASADQVQASYERLARLSHPRNETNFRLAGLTPVLQMLFERATEAYLTLSEPERRQRYNESQEIDLRGIAVTGAKREEEQRILARQQYEHALSLAARGDYHFAVELLTLAVKVDRKVEYFLELARIQAKNPQWTRRAVESCRSALEIDPHNADVRYQLGELYELLGDVGRARAQYAAAARENPNHVQAAAKLRGLQGSATPRKSAGGGLFDKLFGRRDGD